MMKQNESAEPNSVGLPDLLALPKPALGEACNGCGYCCIVGPCHLANKLLNCIVGPCVALERENGRTYCGLVRRPAHYMFGKDAPPSTTATFSVMLATMLGLGHGCDAEDPS